jgi:hypothetical protein
VPSTDSLFTGDGTLANLTQILAANRPYNGYLAGWYQNQVHVTAGETLWVQASGPPGFSTPTIHGISIIQDAANDSFANSINLTTSYTPPGSAIINGTPAFLYTFTAPAGFWTAYFPNPTVKSTPFYLRNWYKINADTNLISVWANQPGNANQGYYDFGSGTAPEIDWSTYFDGPADPYKTLPTANSGGLHYFYPNVWGYSPLDINVAQTWNYYVEQQLQANLGSDPTYRGLFDLSAFPTGPGISYLYAVPGNIQFKSFVAGATGASNSVVAASPITYTFAVKNTDAQVVLNPVFPCANPQTINITHPTISTSANGYNYGATVETGEPAQPGSWGSTWWNLTVPESGWLTVNIQAQNGGGEYAYVWAGTNLATLQPLGNTYGANNNSVTVPVTIGQIIQISCDTANNTPGVYSVNLNLTAGNENTNLQTAATAVPSATRVFENGTNILYSQPFQLISTNDQYVFQMNVPVSGWLTREDKQSFTAKVEQAMQSDAHLSPAPGPFQGSELVSFIAYDDIYGSSQIYYTLDGSAPTTNSATFAAGIASAWNLTNTTTISVLCHRTNQDQLITGTYTWQPGVSSSVTNNQVFTNAATIALTADTNAAVYYSYDQQTWQQYTNPITLNGMNYGTGLIYYYQVVNGVTNATNVRIFDFVAPTPVISPLDASISNGAITVTSEGTDPIAYTVIQVGTANLSYISAGFDALYSMPGNTVSTGTFTNTLSVLPRTAVIKFQTQKAGYQLSTPVYGTYH